MIRSGWFINEIKVIDLDPHIAFLHSFINYCMQLFFIITLTSTMKFFSVSEQNEYVNKWKSSDWKGNLFWLKNFTATIKYIITVQQNRGFYYLILCSFHIFTGYVIKRIFRKEPGCCVLWESERFNNVGLCISLFECAAVFIWNGWVLSCVCLSWKYGLVHFIFITSFYTNIRVNIM